MKIPTARQKLTDFTRDLVEECRVSVQARRDANRVCRRLYLTGQAGDDPPKYNKCYTHVERLGSYLFSAADVRLSLDFEADDDDEWDPTAIAGTRRVNRIWNRSKLGLAFGQGLRAALVDNCAFVKLIWKNGRPVPFVIRNSFIGVYREDLPSLDDQDAFTHSYYLTKAAFSRLISGNPDKTEIMEQVSSHFQPAGNEVIEDTYFHEIIAGGLQPISANGTATGQIGSVGVFGPASPMVSPQVKADMVRVDELWVRNDRNGDWATIRYVDPGILIDGRYKLENLSDIPMYQPFTKICPNEELGYFWGRSEIGGLANIQGLLNRRVNNVDRIFNLQADSPLNFAGFDTLTDEKKRAMLMAGGTIDSSNPNANIQRLAPTMPDIALPYIQKIEGWFDEMAGFTPALLGQADSGVRSSQQGNILLRTGSPPIRERAFLVESQVNDLGDNMLNMVRAKDVTVIKTTDKGEFMMSQLPTDVGVTVDSHSSSPAFSGDNVNMAFALRKSGAIGNPDLLEATNFPNRSRLAAKARKQEKAQAKFIAEHPEILAKGKPGPKPGATRSA